jgi:hypothetical protein
MLALSFSGFDPERTFGSAEADEGDLPVDPFDPWEDNG